MSGLFYVFQNMKEIWKDIYGFEGIYQISTFGRVRSIDRMVTQKCGKNPSKTQTNHIKGKILKTWVINSGYEVVSLRKNKKRFNKLIHRIVAETFLDNLNGYSQINHKDENKLNNYLSNLEWCTPKYNQLYNCKNIKIAIKNGKSVIQINEFGTIVNRFYSSVEAGRKTKIPDRGIRKACLSGKMYKNYFWKYE